MAEYVLIACCSKKLGKETPQKKFLAKEIYQGTLFKYSMKYAKNILKKGDHEIFILSAKHHLLRLDDSIAYYDEYLGDKNAKEVRAWAKIVEKQMDDAGINREKDSFVILAGKKYWKYLDLDEKNRCFPMKYCHGIGEMLHFLKIRSDDANTKDEV